MKFFISEINSRVQFANRKSVASSTGYQVRFCSQYFNINFCWNIYDAQGLSYQSCPKYRVAYIRNFLPLCKTLSLSSSYFLLSLNLLSDRASIVQCLQTSNRSWLLPELPFVVVQGEVARAALAPQSRLLFAQFLCSTFLTDAKEQFGFQWFRVALWRWEKTTNLGHDRIKKGNNRRTLCSQESWNFSNSKLIEKWKSFPL